MLVGLSIGILVIEAAYRSGTSVTAKLAKQQDRKVFVLPHEIEDKHGQGTNQLIRKGATLVTSTKDIIEEFEFLEYKEFQKKKEKKTKKIRNKKYQEIYEIIANGNNSINEIYQKSNQSMSEINNMIVMLEIEGYITKTAGGYICV